MVQQVVYPGLSWNRDEPVYLWQVEVLRSGQLAAPDGGYPDLFLPWLSAARDGELFSQYTLGWPLALLAGSLLGSSDLAVAGGAALAVAGTFALVQELLRDRVVAGVAALLVALSPLLLVQAGTHLNYLFTLGLGLWFATAMISGVRLGRPRRLLAAGALLGWVAWTRPYDAAVWGLVVVAYLAIVHRGRWREHLRRAPWMLAGLLPFVAVVLALNLRLTGSLSEFPITVADPLDRFGFGERRLMPRFGKVAYGRRMALESAGRNSFWLPFFLVGAHAGALLAAFGAWVGRRRWSTAFLLALGLAFPLTYLPFFGTHISSLTARLSGPIYYIPAYVALSSLMAIGLVHLGRTRPRWAAAAVALLAVVTVPIALDRLRVNRELSLANLPWKQSVEHLDEPSLVVVSPTPYLLFLNPYAVNGSDLQGEVLYAADGGPSLLDLVASHPERQAYLQRSDLDHRLLAPTEDPEEPQVSLTPMEVIEGRAVELDAMVRARAGAEHSAVWLEVDGARRAGTVTMATGRELDAAWRVGGPEVAMHQDGVALEPGLHTVRVVAGWGSSERSARHPPAVRRTFYLRVGDGGTQVLVPGTVAFHERRPDGSVDELSWIESLDAAELQVDVSPTG